MSTSNHPATPIGVVSTGTMEFNHTGSWRYLRPEHKERLAPCRRRCPAGTDIPRVMQLAAEGRLEEAARVILRTNPLPAVCGRVCYHPCQEECSRIEMEGAVEIRAVERLLGEIACRLDPLETGPVRDRRVAVVGAGPAGLSCAWFLALNGFRVRVFDSEEQPGGMLRIGIPQFRLPRPLLDRELGRFRRLGVEFVQNFRLGRDRDLESLRKEFDAVFVATGAHKGRKLPFSSRPGVYGGLEFLRLLNAGTAPRVGSKVVVIGGGNTAMDVARAARRLGAEALVAYRRSRTEMPAQPEEVEEAAEEGVEFQFLVAPTDFRDENGHYLLALERMELGAPDETGRRRPVVIPGSECTVECSAVVVAAGESAELPLSGEPSDWPDVFVGGDAETGPGTVPAAIASGRRRAFEIMEFLGFPGEPPVIPEDPLNSTRLNLAYFLPSTAVKPSRLPLAGRLTGFDEILAPIDREQAIGEATRCFTCGVCNSCNTCWIFCPDNAIERVDSGYRINLTYCKGCGICAVECPRGVIDLVPEAS